MIYNFSIINYELSSELSCEPDLWQKERVQGLGF